LQATSPCRDMGTDTVAELPVIDYEGDPRISGLSPDMGADEFHAHLYCMGEASPANPVTTKLVGEPGASPVGLFFGAGVLESPIPHMWGDFFLEEPWVVVPLDAIPSNGIHEWTQRIPGTPAGPYDIPIQALIGFELSNLFVLEVR
ncbi:MAG: hypothetical protein KJ645_08005, partial [Planctomycetes bacterium]|nr:hypothetical protein [Planctomycetota bacterium]